MMDAPVEGGVGTTGGSVVAAQPDIRAETDSPQVRQEVPEPEIGNRLFKDNSVFFVKPDEIGRVVAAIRNRPDDTAIDTRKWLEYMMESREARRIVQMRFEDLDFQIQSKSITEQEYRTKFQQLQEVKKLIEEEGKDLDKRLADMQNEAKTPENKALPFDIRKNMMKADASEIQKQIDEIDITLASQKDLKPAVKTRLEGQRKKLENDLGFLENKAIDLSTDRDNLCGKDVPDQFAVSVLQFAQRLEGKELSENTQARIVSDPIQYFEEDLIAEAVKGANEKAAFLAKLQESGIMTKDEAAKFGKLLDLTTQLEELTAKGRINRIKTGGLLALLFGLLLARVAQQTTKRRGGGGE